MKKYTGWMPIIALSWSIFQLYLAGLGPLTSQIQSSLHLAFALALTFVVFRKGQKSKYFLIRGMDYLMSLVSLASGIYIYIEADRLLARIQFVSDLTLLDYVFCFAILILLLEAARRTVGKSMTILALIFLAYSFLGTFLPGPLHHGGLTLKRLTEVLYYSQDGILGVPLGVSMDYVFYFVLFASFLDHSGGGKLFIDLTFRLTKRSKGGPAKAAVISSALQGTISGSAVGNVVSSGVFTIPLMKRAGYTPTFAASVEAVSSTGGQMMPPIMGAAAFIMADTIGVHYSMLVLAAIIPAILYFFSLFLIVHLQASKSGLKTAESIMPHESPLKQLHLLVPIVILIFFIFLGKTLQQSAFWAIISVVVVSYVRRSTRLKVDEIMDSLISGAKQAIQVAIPCAVAGIVVGVIIHSGLGLTFSSFIIDYSLGIPIISVLFVCFGCIILGMGMPTTSAYITASVLLAPSLAKLGFQPLAVHMFIFYMACLSMVTPPVALASYSAASIAQSKANKTGYLAFYLSIPSFLIPFSFIFNPALLLIGEPISIAWITIKTIVGLIALSGALVGYLIAPTPFLVRILMAAAAILMIGHGIVSDITGLLLFAVLLTIQFRVSLTHL
ncbi:TRAP transporter permease [Brevibacillus sp. H7]|uniref:TRAP transporter permease n=1 Tax=Brevibacillus sp. H7 TaxID=3349138 RepID=UPI00381A8B26